MQSYNTYLNLFLEAEKYKDADITFRDEVTGHHSGQTNLNLYAIIDGKIAGTLEYVKFNDVPSISMIKVKPAYQRMGIGKALVLNLQKEFPDTEIEWGMTTPEGTALKDSLKDELYVDMSKAELKKKYDALIAERGRYQKKMDDLYRQFDTDPDEIRKEIKKLNDRYVELDDEIYELEKEI